MARLRVAAVQVATPGMDPDFDRRRRVALAAMDRYLELILGLNPTVDLVVYPELFFPGPDVANFRALAEEIPGPFSNAVCERARRLGKWILPGTFFERGPQGQVFNTAILISPDGSIALKYRKACVPYPLEPSVPGDAFPVAEIEGVGRVGVMICSDGHWPEVCRTLALQGAELVLKPTLQPYWIGGPRNHGEIVVTRASENQLYLISVNQPTPIGMGLSVAVDPEGRRVEALGEAESFLVVSVDFDEVRRVREEGSFGMFCFLKMLREYSEAGVPLCKVYQDGLRAAPVYAFLRGRAPRSPQEIGGPDAK